MIITPKIVARLALIILVAVILQVAFFSKITILGTAPNILPVIAVCLGLLGGAVVGAGHRDWPGNDGPLSTPRGTGARGAHPVLPAAAGTPLSAGGAPKTPRRPIDSPRFRYPTRRCGGSAHDQIELVNT